MSTHETNHATEVDATLKALCRKPARPLDMERFETGLRSRLECAEKRERRRPVVRRLSLAAAGLLLVAGAGIGAWQAVDHLRGPDDLLIIGDPADQPSVIADPTDQPVTNNVTSEFAFEVARSISTLKLAEVWNTAATGLGLDLGDARLEGLDLGWSEGQLSGFGLQLDGVMPDGLQVRVASDPEPPRGEPGFEQPAAGEVLLLRASIVSYRTDEVASTPAARMSTMLAALDTVGLTQIVTQTGAASDQTDWALYMGSVGSPLRTDAYEESLAQELGTIPFVLTVSAGTVQRVESTDLLPALLPTLLPAEVLKLQTTQPGDGGVFANIVVGPLLDAGASATPTLEPQLIDEGLDGMVLKSWASAWRIGGGQLEPVDALEFGRAFSYSLGRGWLVGMSTGESTGGWPGEPNESGVLALPASDGREPLQLLSNSPETPIIDVRYDENADRVWFSRLSTDPAGPNEMRLWTAAPRGAEPVAIPLNGPFGGDFDLSPDGATVVYAGPWPTLAQIGLHSANADEQLQLGLATAYDPVFSPDGTKICLVGSKDESDETSLWIYDLESEAFTQMEATEGLTPTHPTFSPDGRRIAFRGFWDSYLWTLDVKSGELHCWAMSLNGSPRNAGDAPIVW